MDQLDIPLSPEGKIVGFLTGNVLEAKPEEFVRQQYLRVLHFEYQYPKSHLAREVPVYYGSKELKDSEGRPVRADIVIYQRRLLVPRAIKAKLRSLLSAKHRMKLQAITNLSLTSLIQVLDVDSEEEDLVCKGS